MVADGEGRLQGAKQQRCWEKKSRGPYLPTPVPTRSACGVSLDGSAVFASGYRLATRHSQFTMAAYGS
jgi:hypothetical protein